MPTLKKSTPGSDLKVAYNYAIKLLSGRDYAFYELVGKLEKYYLRQVALEACALCQQQGYQSDERYAQMLCKHLRQRGYGPLRFALEARNKKLKTDLIEQLIDQVDWNLVAYNFLQKKYGQDLKLLKAGFEDQTQYFKWQQKTLASLYRRGFSAAMCRQSLKIYLSGKILATDP